ncbi:MAG TPA: hypothetical protein P5125_08185, partial [Kiritimatiellia bacterium]|nr:hypothetical protein [Kiritimatiellia bacterium]
QIGIGVGIGIGIDYFTTGHFLGFHGFRFQGFKVSWFHPNRDRGRYRYRDRLFHHGTLSWVSWFQVSRFQGFMVSSKSGSGSVSVSGSIISPRDAFLGFGVSRFHGFIQIGVAIAIGIGIAIGIAIGIDFPDTWS